MTEREKRRQRQMWKEASKKYREKKKALSGILHNTPPHSNADLAASASVRKTVGSQIVRKDRAKAYRKIKQQEKIIAKIKRKYDTLTRSLPRHATSRDGALQLYMSHKIAAAAYWILVFVLATREGNYLSICGRGLRLAILNFLFRVQLAAH